MDPGQFAEPQRGLVVTEAFFRDRVGRVVTTGAEITIQTATGEILLGQRIGTQLSSPDLKCSNSGIGLAPPNREIFPLRSAPHRVTGAFLNGKIDGAT